MGGEEQRSGREGPANDNHPPSGQDAESKVETFERLDAVVLSIARLIGRRMAREDFEKAMQAANDNASKSGDEQEPS